MKVNVSEPKTRLFIGNIPKSKGKDEIEEEFKKLSGKNFIHCPSTAIQTCNLMPNLHFLLRDLTWQCYEIPAKIIFIQEKQLRNTHLKQNKSF